MTFGGDDRADDDEASLRVSLTGREVSLVCLVAAGLTNGQIGRELRISPHTVAQHIAEMLRRYHVRSRSELVAKAYAAGVLQTGVWPPRRAVSLLPRLPGTRRLLFQILPSS